MLPVIKALFNLTKRKAILEKVILNDLSKEESELYFNYSLDDSDFEFLRKNIKKVLQIIPADAYNCSMLSAILGAKIFDETKIPVVIIAGHLNYNNKRIFECNKPIPNSINNIKGEFWDGHCWIELGGYILDISIFRTIYYGEVPLWIKEKIINEFGTGRGSLMGKISQLEEVGFEYIPRYILTQDQINGLISGAEMKYFKN